MIQKTAGLLVDVREVPIRAIEAPEFLVSEIGNHL